jgi:hypothetical protein
MQFNATFRPREDTDYTWVVEHAEKRYAERVTDFEYMDAKAASLLTYLGGGAGVLSLGGAVTLFTSPVSPWVVFAGIPAIVIAFVSMGYALVARRPVAILTPPAIREAAAYAASYEDPKVAMAGLLGQWDVATEDVRPETMRKTGLVRTASILAFIAVMALILPLLVRLWIKSVVPDASAPISADARGTAKP